MDIVVEKSTDTRKAASPRPAVPVKILGQGYDTFMNAGRATIVDGNPTASPSTVTSYYKLCYDFESVAEALRVSATASASFAEGGGTVKTELLTSLDITTTTLTIVVYTNVARTTSWTDWTLKEGAPTEPEPFFRAFGDSFVSTLVDGAEYMAVYVFYCNSVREQLALATSLAGEGILEGGTLKGDLQTALSRVTTTVTVRQDMKQLVVGARDPRLPSADGVVEYALAFPTIPHDYATVSWITTGYENVAGAPDFTKVASNRSLVLGTPDDPSNPGLARNLATLATAYNQVRWIQQVYDRYGYAGDEAFTRNGKAIAADIGKITALLVAIDGAPTTPWTAPSLPALALGSPSLEVRVEGQADQVWGGSGGEWFRDVSYESVAALAWIHSLEMRGDKWVDQLSITYDLASGDQTDRHGGGGGEASGPRELGARERIVRVVGTYDRYVNQLAFFTNTDPTTPLLEWPPHPERGAHAIDWTIPDGKVLLGFQGRSERFLDQLQPVLLAFSPAVWERS